MGVRESSSVMLRRWAVLGGLCYPPPPGPGLTPGLACWLELLVPIQVGLGDRRCRAGHSGGVGIGGETGGMARSGAGGEASVWVGRGGNVCPHHKVPWQAREGPWMRQSLMLWPSPCRHQRWPFLHPRRPPPTCLPRGGRCPAVARYSWQCPGLGQVSGCGPTG